MGNTTVPVGLRRPGFVISPDWLRVIAQSLRCTPQLMPGLIVICCILDGAALRAGD